MAREKRYVVCAHYSQDKTTMTLPKKEKPTKRRRKGEQKLKRRKASMERAGSLLRRHQLIPFHHW